MPIITTTTIYHRDGSEKTVDVHESSRLVGAGQLGAGSDWSMHKPPPPGWEREVPKYKVTRDVRPPEKARFRFELPFSQTFDSDVFQYSEGPLQAGQIIEITSWPHASFQPLNYSAEKVLAFFRSAMKSRLPLSPWQNGQVRLDDGLSGTFPTIGQVQTPKIPRFNTSPGG